MTMTTRRTPTPEEQAARQKQIELLKRLAPDRGTFESLVQALLSSKLLPQGSFKILPVIFKTPALRNYQLMSSDTRLRLAQPWHNVAIWSSRGVGNLTFVDIDDPRIVRGKIEEATGKLFPRTYTVATRPFSEHVHYYFKQTQYSVQKFCKTMNVRDLDNLKTTLYDVKGVGGTSYVVAAGSVRENGDKYAVDDQYPVQEIEPWLVDWIVDDFKKFKAGKATLKKKRLAEQAALEEKFTPEQRAEMRQQNIPDGFYIAADDSQSYLRWRAGQLASLGLPRDFIQQGLRRLVVEDCVNGKEYLQTHEESIAHIADNPTLHIGNPSWFYKRGVSSGEVLIGARPVENLSEQRSEQSRHGAMVEIIEAFPNEIDSEEAWQFLREGVIGFNKLGAQKQAVAAARAEAGFEVKALGNHHWSWIRKGSR